MSILNSRFIWKIQVWGDKQWRSPSGPRFARSAPLRGFRTWHVESAGGTGKIEPALGGSVSGEIARHD
jgi:hypothetical protein